MRKYLYPLLALTLFQGPLNAQNRIGTGNVTNLYKQHCAICHGQELEGGLGGSLLGKLDYVENEADLTRWIRDGNPDLGMPAFSPVLSGPEIRSLVIYTLEMRQKAERIKEPAVSREDSESVFTAGGHTFRWKQSLMKSPFPGP